MLFLTPRVQRRKTACAISAVCFLLVIAFVVNMTVHMNMDSIIAGSTASSSHGTVIIDAGHGGEDSGAVGVNGVLEKDINLSVAMIMGDMLISHGYSVVYTRTEDKLLYTEKEDIKGIRKISDLKNRCLVACERPDAVFVSIHMNSYGASKYSGLQVYYSANNPDSRILADKIQRRVKDELQPHNKRVSKLTDAIYVLSNVPNTAVLVECGFLTNPEECAKLSEKEYQKQLSFSVICAIIEYING